LKIYLKNKSYIDYYRLLADPCEHCYSTIKSAIAFLRDFEPDPKYFFNKIMRKSMGKSQAINELKEKAMQFKYELSNKILEQSGPI